MGNVNFSDEEERQFQKAGNALADGQYVGILVDASVGVYGKDRNKKLCLTYEVLTPENLKGSEYRHYLALDIPAIHWLVKKTLSQFMLNTKDLKLGEIEESMQGKIGAKIVFSLATKDKYQNTSIDQVFEATDEKGGLPDFGEGEDIPL